MKQLTNLFVVMTLLVAVGCSALYVSVITVTQVRNSAMTELANLYAQGKIDAELDARIEIIDANYILAAKTAEQAFIAYKNGGDRSTYPAALKALQGVVANLIDLLTPLVTPDKTAKLTTDLQKASKP